MASTDPWFHGSGSGGSPRPQIFDHFWCSPRSIAWSSDLVTPSTSTSPTGGASANLVIEWMLLPPLLRSFSMNSTQSDREMAHSALVSASSSPTK